MLLRPFVLYVCETDLSFRRKNRAERHPEDGVNNMGRNIETAQYTKLPNPEIRSITVEAVRETKI
jgi:hypothetical protein